MDWIGLSMVLRLRQHNIGYTADGFYRSDDPTNSMVGYPSNSMASSYSIRRHYELVFSIFHVG